MESNYIVIWKMTCMCNSWLTYFPH